MATTKKKLPKSVLKKRKARQNRKAAKLQRAAVQERLAVKTEPPSATPSDTAPAPAVKVEYVTEAPSAPSALDDVVARFARRAAAQYERGLQRDPETDGSDTGDAGSDAADGAGGMDEGTDASDAAELSNKRVRRSSTLTVGVLKRLSARPDVVELHDVNSSDPLLHVYLKSLHNAVPVPRHWCAKRRYLAGKVGVLKPPFRLPQYIEDTGIRQVREAEQAREDAKSHAKSAARQRMQPRMGRLDIDFRVLQAAFFRFQTKPRMTEFGDLYYEGKEHDLAAAAAGHRATPGVLSVALQRALGMLPPTTATTDKGSKGGNSNKDGKEEEDGKEDDQEAPGTSLVPPPWLFAMQRLGPPPAYPHLRVPGVNAPLPAGAQYGFQAGGWGRPPVDEATGAALFGGDPLGVGAAAGGGTVGAVGSDELAAMATHWGECAEDFAGLEDGDEMADDDGEDGDDDEDRATVVTEDGGGRGAGADESGTRTGFESSAGLATPAAIDLVKRTAASVEAEQQMQQQMQAQQQQQQQPQEPRQLYTVLEQQEVANPVATVSAHSLLGATHTYRLPGTADQSAATEVGATGADAAAVLQSRHEQETADAQQAHELQQRYQDIAQPEETKKPKKKKNKDKEKFKF